MIYDYSEDEPDIPGMTDIRDLKEYKHLFTSVEIPDVWFGDDTSVKLDQNFHEYDNKEVR